LATRASEGAPNPEAHATVSVALCTYNGVSYLSDQLESIADQTVLPAELVVCDDRSTDDTVALVESFAGSAPFPVRIHRNPENLGSTRNFEQAIGLCTGDLIALCDQDDVWRREKVARLQDSFVDPIVGFAFSDGDLIDASGRPTGVSLWMSMGFTPRRRKRFSGPHQFAELLRRNCVTGAAMAFRASLRPMILPLSPSIIQDKWISLLLAGLGLPGVAIPERLIGYRQHAEQQVGAPPTSVSERFERKRSKLDRWLGDHIEALRALRDRLDALTPDGDGERVETRRLIDAKIEHLERRQRIRSRGYAGRVFPVISELLSSRYLRFSGSNRSAAVDLWS